MRFYCNAPFALYPYHRASGPKFRSPQAAISEESGLQESTCRGLYGQCKFLVSSIFPFIRKDYTKQEASSIHSVLSLQTSGVLALSSIFHFHAEAFRVKGFTHKLFIRYRDAPFLYCSVRVTGMKSTAMPGLFAEVCLPDPFRSYAALSGSYEEVNLSFHPSLL